MLVLSRRWNQEVVLTTQHGEKIVVTVAEISRDQAGQMRAKLGFTAPPSVVIYRREVQNDIDGVLGDDSK